MRNIAICVVFKGVKNKKCPKQSNLRVTVLDISLIMFIIFPLLLWALTSGQTAAVGHRDLKVWAFFFSYQQFTHEGEQSVYQAFKTRTELTDVWEKNTTCEREAVKSCRLQIQQQQQQPNATAASSLSLGCSCWVDSLICLQMESVPTTSEGSFF